MIRRCLLLALLLPAIGCSTPYLSRDTPLPMDVICDCAVPAEVNTDRALKVVAVALSDMKWEIISATRDAVRVGYMRTMCGSGTPDQFRFELLATTPQPGVVMVSRPDAGEIGEKDTRLLQGYVARLQGVLSKASCYTDKELERKLRYHHIWF